MSNPNVTIDRQKYIGGSDLPSILGFNTKYGKSIYEFAREKAGIIPNPFKGNEYTKYGQIMEPVIRDYINSLYGTKYHEDTIINEEKGYRGNTDGIDETADIPIIEIKTFGDELDVDYYEPQCQFYMETFDKNQCLLIGYKRPEDFYSGLDYDMENEETYFNKDFDPSRITTKLIKRDTELWNTIEEKITVFKKCVELLKTNPDMTEEEFCKHYYGSDIMTACNKIQEINDQLEQFNLLTNEFKKEKENLYNLFDKKGILSVDTEKYHITKVNPTSYDTITIDVEKLQSDYKEIYEKYKKVKTTNKKGYIMITKKEKK